MNSTELDAAMVQHVERLHRENLASAEDFAEATKGLATLRTVSWSITFYESGVLRRLFDTMILAEHDEGAIRGNAEFSLPRLADAILALPNEVKLPLIRMLLDDQIKSLDEG